ncbi:MAG: sugar phosphate isomerase/epimerase [bacterium]
MKKQNRREFIGTLGAAAATTLFVPKILLAKDKRRTIGIQLYTLRDMLAEDFEGTLDTISRIGYTTVESFGYMEGKFFGNYPGEFKNILHDYGLKHVSTHIKLSLKDAPEIIDDTLESGAQYLILPWLPEEDRQSLDDYKKLADELNQIGTLCQKAGLHFGYHNHAFEFEEMDGMIPYNILLDNTEPELVCMELDIYWVVRAGYNPQEYFNRNPGRFKLWHVKDMDESEEMKFAPVGKGIINFQAIYKQKEKAGLKYSFVEQDNHLNEDPVQNIKDSFRYLSDLPNYG